MPHSRRECVDPGPADRRPRRANPRRPNEIESALPPSRSASSLIGVGADQEPLVFVLLAAAAISLLAGKTADAIVIGVVIVVNSLIGFFQEYRAEAALEALKAQAAPEAEVVRDCPDVGECVEMRIPTAEIVPGDVILLDAGARCPPMRGSDRGGQPRGRRGDAHRRVALRSRKTVEPLARTPTCPSPSARTSSTAAPSSPRARQGRRLRHRQADRDGQDRHADPGDRKGRVAAAAADPDLGKKLGFWPSGVAA
jgi:hypothetical protein